MNSISFRTSSKTRNEGVKEMPWSVESIPQVNEMGLLYLLVSDEIKKLYFFPRGNVSQF